MRTNQTRQIQSAEKKIYEIGSQALGKVNEFALEFLYTSTFLMMKNVLTNIHTFFFN